MFNWLPSVFGFGRARGERACLLTQMSFVVHVVKERNRREFLRFYPDARTPCDVFLEIHLKYPEVNEDMALATLNTAIALAERHPECVVFVTGVSFPPG